MSFMFWVLGLLVCIAIGMVAVELIIAWWNRHDEDWTFGDWED